MRKIYATLFISLDGVVDRMEEWHFNYFDEEMGAAVDRVMSTADTFLLGRKTYESFAGAWPNVEATGEGEDAEFARHLGDARKVVVSHQDLEFEWRNSENLKGDLIEGVRALKEEPGETHIAISGSPSIVRQLVSAGLLDELHLLVHPVAAGKGLRLFESETPIPLKLISSKTLPTGVLDLVYAPSDSQGDATADEKKVLAAQSS